MNLLKDGYKCKNVNSLLNISQNTVRAVVMRNRAILLMTEGAVAVLPKQNWRHTLGCLLMCIIKNASGSKTSCSTSLRAFNAMHKGANVVPSQTHSTANHACRDNKDFHTSCPQFSLQTFYVMSTYLFPSFWLCVSPILPQGFEANNHSFNLITRLMEAGLLYTQHNLHKLHVQRAATTEIAVKYNVKWNYAGVCQKCSKIYGMWFLRVRIVLALYCNIFMTFKPLYINSINIQNVCYLLQNIQIPLYFSQIFNIKWIKQAFLPVSLHSIPISDEFQY